MNAAVNIKIRVETFGLALATIGLYLRRVYSRFSDAGVSHFRPLPLLGNLGGLTFKKHHIAEEVKRQLDAFPNDRFIGHYALLKPTILLQDLDLIKQVTVKDFDHFHDHRFIVDDTVDTLFGRSLFALRGQEWRDMRSTLSPAFTSAKIRNMVLFMLQVNKQMINVLKDDIKQSETDYIDLESKDLTSRYANDVIASCAFGVKVDSHKNKENEFYKVGKSVGTFGPWRIFAFLGYSNIPNILKFCGVKFFNNTIKSFLKSLVLGTMKDREANSIHRPDMIHLLMEAKRGQLREEKKELSDAGFATVEEFDLGQKTLGRIWSDDDLVAQAFVFFLAGYETVSSTLSFLLHELALNPDVQDRLLKEIRDTDERNQGKVDYKSIQSMTYMDMVVSEVLRRWPPVVGLDRECAKDYNLGKPNEYAKRDFIIRKGELLGVPVWALHHQPKYFPDPLRFDPERFSEENKAKIIPGSYMPFGNGPRNCIGSRFALCEVKAMVYQLLQHLELSACPRTSHPAQLSVDAFTVGIKGGHWVRLKLRK